MDPTQPSPLGPEPSPPEPFFEGVPGHAELVQLLVDLNRDLAQHPDGSGDRAWYRAFGERLRRLLSSLHEHFAAEERAGGFFEAAVAQDSGVRERVRNFRDQHRILFEWGQDLASTGLAVGEILDPRTFADEVRAFFKALGRHEADENALAAELESGPAGNPPRPDGE